MIPMGKKISALLISAALVVGMCVPSFAADAPSNTISVAGKGVVSVEPDTAVMDFTIETDGSNASQAQSKNSEIFNKVSETLENAGISKDNIKTSYYYVYPKYKYDDDGNETLIGYEATNSFEVTTTDKDNVGKYIDIALKAGVTQNGGVSFKISQPEKYYSEALADSIQNARLSAETIAKSLGKTLGSPISVTELGDGNAYNVYNKGSGKYVAGGAGSSAVEDSGSSYVDIGYDKIDVTANVTVVYSFN
jgi:uncharacterized protein YggE